MSSGQPFLMNGWPFGCPLPVESARLSNYWNGQSLYRFSRFLCRASSGLKLFLFWMARPSNQIFVVQQKPFGSLDATVLTRSSSFFQELQLESNHPFW
jgi:hypothetical protein